MINRIGKAPLLFGLIGTVVLVIFSCLYLYTYEKKFLIEFESECVDGEICYVRDCEVDGCPPNNLAEYRLFSINAAVFSQCSINNSCVSFCSNEDNQDCAEIICDSEENICTSQE